MQTFIHRADNSDFKIEYVYRQTPLFFLLYILNCRKGDFYAYEQTNVVYGNKLSKPKTINRIVASFNFYCYLNALHFMKKHLLYKFLEDYKLMSVACMLIIGPAALETGAHWLYAAARHTMTPTPMTTSHTLNISSDMRSHTLSYQ